MDLTPGPEVYLAAALAQQVAWRPDEDPDWQRRIAERMATEPGFRVVVDLAYRAGQEDAAREARPMLNAVYSALDHASQLCRFHGAQYAAAGFQFGLPRCESCRQPWRVARALDLVNQAREVDQPRTPSGCDGEDSPEERTDG